jgi:hypothetical protein
MVEASLDDWLTTGRFSDEFEQGLANLLGMKYLITVNPILQFGAVPVFVDVELGTCNIDAAKVEAAIGPRTGAVMLAHTLGNPYDLDVITALCRKYKLWLIEDCCNALGSTYSPSPPGEKAGVGQVCRLVSLFSIFLLSCASSLSFASPFVNLSPDPELAALRPVTAQGAQPQGAAANEPPFLRWCSTSPLRRKTPAARSCISPTSGTASAPALRCPPSTPRK